MIQRSIVEEDLRSLGVDSFDWFNDYHDTARWVGKNHPQRNDLKAWLSDGWKWYSAKCLEERREKASGLFYRSAGA